MKFTVMILLGILCWSCQRHELEEKTFRNNAVPAELQEGESIVLETQDIVFPMSYYHAGSFFTLLDPFARKCYTFSPDGRLRSQIGGIGQGPGEYQMPMAMTVAGDRLMVVSGTDRRTNVYDLDGHFINSESNPYTGFVTTLTPFGNTILGTIFSRYTTYTLFLLDKNGKMIETMVPRPKAYDHVFDTLWPAGGALVEGQRILLFNNYAYAIHVLGPKGEQIETVKFASSFYQEPDMAAAKKVKGSEAEKAFRTTFTPLSGLYAYLDGYLTVLSKPHVNGNDTQRLEFWSHNFESHGYYQAPEDMTFLGVHGERLVFFKNTTKPTLQYATMVNPFSMAKGTANNNAKPTSSPSL